ncbi:MAG: hybrid sensor histidine kinase/response regulator [Caldilineaceae bacterium]
MLLHDSLIDDQNAYSSWQTLENAEMVSAQSAADLPLTNEPAADHFLRSTHYFDLLVQHIQAILPVELCLILTPAGLNEIADYANPSPQVGHRRNSAADVAKLPAYIIYHASYNTAPVERHKLFALWGPAQLTAHLERWRTGFADSRPLYIPTLPNNPRFGHEEMDAANFDFEDTASVDGANGARLLLGSLLLLPIKYRSQVVGLLHLQTRHANGFTASHFHLLSSLTPLIGSYLYEAERANQTHQAYLTALHDRTLLGRRIVDFTAQITSLKTELAMAQRTKEDFLAMMSHELRTPLTVIMTRSELMLSSVNENLSPRQRDSLVSIDMYAKRLLTIVNNMLDLVGIDNGNLTLNLECVNTADICHKIINDMQAEAANHHLQITTKLHAQPLNIVADRYRLTQMLSNLLQNAIKFTPDGGAIGLEETYDPETQMVQFHVWDTGIGISPNAKQHIFEPFFQFDSSLTRFYEGSGLGLAMVARLAELHGGTISVSSTPGQGAQFTLALPVNASIEAAGQRNHPKPAFHFQRAFVVDSHEESIESLIAWLSEWGIQPYLHPHANDVVARILNFYPDVILLNLQADNGRGWKVLNQILTVAHLSHIPIVTLFSEPSAAAQHAGASADVKAIPTTTAVTQDALYHALKRAQSMVNSRSVIVAAE